VENSRFNNVEVQGSNPTLCSYNAKLLVRYLSSCFHDFEGVYHVHYDTGAPQYKQSRLARRRSFSASDKGPRRRVASISIGVGPSNGIVLDVEYGHLMVVFTLSISGRAIFVICRNGLCPSLGV
jgi:hypothetical protein